MIAELGLCTWRPSSPRRPRIYRRRLPRYRRQPSIRAKRGSKLTAVNVIKAIVIFRNMFLFLGRQALKNQDSSNNEIISTIDRWLKNDGVIGAQRPQLIRPTVILDSQSPSK